MLRIAACLVCVVLALPDAFATCTDEVIAAWRRLHVAGPYIFTIRVVGDPKNWLSAIIDRPRALRHWRDGATGRNEVVRIGSRMWVFSEGSWHPGAEVSPPNPPVEQTILEFESLFNFEAETLAKKIHDARCLGHVTREGRVYTGYCYGVRTADGVLIIREKLYVDTTTGLPARLEHEAHFSGSLGQRFPLLVAKPSFASTPP